MQRNTFRLLCSTKTTTARKIPSCQQQRFVLTKLAATASASAAPSPPISKKRSPFGTNPSFDPSLHPLSVLVSRAQNLLSSSTHATTNQNKKTEISLLIQARNCLKEVLSETKSERLRHLVSALDEAIVLQEIRDRRTNNNSNDAAATVQDDENSASSSAVERRTGQYFQSVIPVASLLSTASCCSSEDSLLQKLTAEFDSYLAKGFFVQTFISSAPSPSPQTHRSSRTGHEAADDDGDDKTTLKNDEFDTKHLEMWNKYVGAFSSNNNLVEFIQERILRLPPDTVSNEKECCSKLAFQSQKEICLFASLCLFLDNCLDQSRQHQRQRHHQQYYSSASSTSLSQFEDSCLRMCSERTTKTTSASLESTFFIIASSILKRCLIHQDRCSAPLLGLIKSATSLLFKTIPSTTTASSTTTTNNNAHNAAILDFAPVLSVLVAMLTTSVFPRSVVATCVLDVAFLASSTKNRDIASSNQEETPSLKPWVIQHIVGELAVSVPSLLPMITVHERILHAMLLEIHRSFADPSCSLIISKISSRDLSAVFDPIIKMKAEYGKNHGYFSSSSFSSSSNEETYSEPSLENLLFDNHQVCKAVACLHPEWSLWIDLVVPIALRNDIAGFRELFSPTAIIAAGDGGHSQRREHRLDLSRLAPHQRRLAALVGQSEQQGPTAAKATPKADAASHSSSHSTTTLPSWRQALLLYSAVSGSTYSSKIQSAFALPATASGKSSKQIAKFIRQVAAACTIEMLHRRCISSPPLSTSSFPSHVPFRLARALLATDDDSDKSASASFSGTNLTPQLAAQLVRLACSSNSGGEWSSALQLHESFGLHFNDKKILAKNASIQQGERLQKVSSIARQHHYLHHHHNHGQHNNDDEVKSDDNSSSSNNRFLEAVKLQETSVFNSPEYQSLITSIVDYASKTAQMAAQISSVARHTLACNWAGVLSVFPSTSASSSSSSPPSSPSSSSTCSFSVLELNKKHVTTSVAYACLASGNWLRSLHLLMQLRKQQEQQQQVEQQQKGGRNENQLNSFLLSSPSSSSAVAPASVLFNHSSSTSSATASALQQWLRVAKMCSSAPTEALRQFHQTITCSSSSSFDGLTFQREQDLLFDENNDVEAILQETGVPHHLNNNSGDNNNNNKNSKNSKSKQPVSMKRLRDKLDAIAASNATRTKTSNNNQKPPQESTAAVVVRPTKVTTKLHSLRRTTTLIRSNGFLDGGSNTQIISHESSPPSSSSSRTEIATLKQERQYFEALRNVYRPSGQAFSRSLYASSKRSMLEQQQQHQQHHHPLDDAAAAAAAWQDALELLQDAWMASERGELRPDVYLGTLQHFNIHYHRHDPSSTTGGLQAQQQSDPPRPSLVSAPPPQEVTKSLVNFTKNSPAFRLDRRVASALIKTAAAAHLWSDVIDCFFILLDTSRYVPDRSSIAVVLTACNEIDVKCDKLLAEVKMYLETTLEDSFALLGDALQHVKWFRGNSSTTIVTMEVRCSEYGRVNSTMTTTMRCSRAGESLMGVSGTTATSTHR